MAAAGFGGVAQAHWQQYAAPPEPLGPLRSAQAAGPGAAGAAAAAAANGLARTFVHQAQPSHGGSMRQWSGPGDEPGRVHAPPDTGCLPTGRLQQQDASAAGMRDASASAAGTCTPRHMQLPPTPQGSPLAALAAAVSATGRMGPLQQPLQLQLGDLASKVHQLEAWFESQVGQGVVGGRAVCALLAAPSLCCLFAGRAHPSMARGAERSARGRAVSCCCSKCARLGSR